jgi:hypothetical protein
MSFGAGEYSFAAYIIGGTVSMVAAGKLYEYKHRFALCIGTSVAYMVLGAYDAVGCLDTMLLWELPLFGEAVSEVVDVVRFALELAHTLCLLWAVMDLSAAAGVEKVHGGAVRNAVLTGLWAVGQLVLVLFPAVAAFENQTITKILLLYQILLYLLNAWLLFRAYQLICPEGEENGRDRKPSRFAFVNTVRNKLDEKTERAVQESMEYQSQRAAQKAAQKAARSGGQKNRGKNRKNRR